MSKDEPLSQMAGLALQHTLSHHAHFDEPSPAPPRDIEHTPVEDDPRLWGAGKKRFVLGLMSIAVVSHRWWWLLTPAGPDDLAEYLQSSGRRRAGRPARDGDAGGAESVDLYPVREWRVG